jgi:hypothetical protein
MSYAFYKIDTQEAFDALGVVRVNYNFNLEGIGLVDVSIVKKRFYSMIVTDPDGELLFLPINLNDRNGFNKQNRTAFLDEDGVFYLGFNNEV